MAKRLLLICLISLLAARSASAQTDYSMNYAFDTSHAKTFDITFARLDSADLSHPTWSTIDVYAGPFSASFNSPAPPGYPSSFAVYCVDLDHYDTTPQSVHVLPFTTTSNPSGTPPIQGWNTLRQIAWLYDAYASTVVGNWDASAALQAAIWYTLEQGNFPAYTSSGVTDTHGSFYITADSYKPDGVHLRTSSSDFSTIVGDANAYLSALHGAVQSGGGLGAGTLFQVDRHVSPTYGQDMIGPAAAPEGSTLVMLGCGLLPIAAMLRRKRGGANARPYMR